MESPFKKFMKTMGLFIILVLVSYVGFKYHYLKKEGKLHDVWNQSKTKNDVVYVEGELADPYRESNSEKDESDLRPENASSDSNFFTEKQNYDDYYNKFNFDNFFLLYEGEQHAQETIIVINRLIKNIDDTENKIQKVSTTFEENQVKIVLCKEDTNIEAGEYLYDVQCSLSNGIVDTVILPTKFEVLGGITHD